MKELPSFHLGSFANYCGVHFFNSQFEVARAQDVSGKYVLDNTFLFRPSVSLDHSTVLVPRSLFVDLKDNYGGLGRHGWVPEVHTDALLLAEYGSDLQIIREAQPSKSRYVQALEDALAHEREFETVHAVGDAEHPVIERVDYNLDEDVKTWSDYMSFNLDKLNLLQANSYAPQYNSFSQGRMLLSASDSSTFLLSDGSWEDKVHKMLEECDYPDGFVLYVDVSSGFCGSAAALLNLLRESSKAFRLVIPVSQSQDLFEYPDLSEIPDPAHFPYEFFNRCLTHHSVFDSASLVMPMSLSQSTMFSHLCGNLASSPYTASAVISAAIDVITSGVRMVNPDGLSFGQTFSHLLSSSSMKFNSLGLCLPFSLSSRKSLCDSLFESPDCHLRDDFTNLTAENFSFEQVVYGLKKEKQSTAWKRIADEDDDEGDFDESIGGILSNVDDPEMMRAAKSRFNSPFSYYSVARGLGSVPGVRIAHDADYKFSRDIQEYFSVEWARAEDPSDLWDLYHSSISTRIGKTHHCATPLLLPVTFPSVTSPSLSSFGEVLGPTTLDQAGSRHVLSMPAAAMARSGKGIGYGFRQLALGVASQKRHWNGLTRYFVDTEVDEWSEVSEFLSRMSDMYIDS
eukprot:ANDGO_02255.mRNA.1 Protein misato